MIPQMSYLVNYIGQITAATAFNLFIVQKPYVRLNRQGQRVTIIVPYPERYVSGFGYSIYGVIIIFNQFTLNAVAVAISASDIMYNHQ